MKNRNIVGRILGILFILLASACTITIKEGEYIDVGAGIATATPGENGEEPGIVLVPTISYRKTAATYRISVRTGDVSKGGTDANVFINLIGDQGETSWAPLDNGGHNDFEKGSTDRFELTLVNAGELRQVCISHDNSGDGPGWFVEDIQIENDEGESWHIDFNQWLAQDEGSGELWTCR